MTTRDEALRALVNTIIRDCCESETSDPERDYTIMIREGTLREILERALLTTRQEVAPVAPLGFVLRDKDGGDWWPETFCIGEPEDDETDDAEWTPVYTSTGQTSDARDGNG